jgi:hypothetical protein
MADYRTTSAPEASPFRGPLRFLIFIFVLALAIGLQSGTLMYYIGSAVFWFPAVLLALSWIIFAYLYWAHMRQDPANALASDALTHLFESGRLDEAERESLYLLESRNRGAEWNARRTLIRVDIRKQRFELAARRLGELAQIKGVPGGAVALLNAQLHAISSELEVAERNYDEATELATKQDESDLLLTRTLIENRRGAYKLIAEMRLEEWFLAEGAGSPATMRQLRVLRAFAMKNLPGTEHADEIQMLLAGARPCKPGEYDFLAVRLPELKAFLVEAGLSKTAEPLRQTVKP